MTQNHSLAIEIRKEVAGIEEVFKTFKPFPPEAILFGIAEDGFPVVYNITNTASPNTMIWDRLVGQGLRLVKVAIEFLLRFKSKRKYLTEFVILSNNTREWMKLTENELGVWSKNECIAVVPFWDKVSDQVIFALSGWCVAQRGTKKPLIIFIDGFENILKMSEEAQHNLIAVMSYGRAKNIYVIATAKSESRQELAWWLDYFQAEIYGQEQVEWLEMVEKRKSILFWTPETSI